MGGKEAFTKRENIYEFKYGDISKFCIIVVLDLCNKE